MRSSEILIALVAPVAALGGWAAAVFVFQPYGHRRGVFALVAALLAGVLVGLRLRPGPLMRRGRRRPGPLNSRRLVESVLVGTLTCWLGLIAWSGLSPGGADPAPRSNVDEIRVVTWNVLHGTEHGAPWARFDWPVRKEALRSAIGETSPDILCVQEAVLEQVESIALMLPGYRRVGVGRDDGRSGGEHCAIYFDGRRFEDRGSGTFWLEEPMDMPPPRTLGGPKRICTWVRLRDRHNGGCLRVYNTHFPLTEGARLEAGRIILARLSLGDPTDAILVAGDFNATPGAPCRRLLAEAGLPSSAEVAGRKPDEPTYQFYGIPIRSLDAILVDRGFRVGQHRVLDMKPGNTYPSDHFGVMADLALDPTRLQSRPPLLRATAVSHAGVQCQSRFTPRPGGCVLPNLAESCVMEEREPNELLWRGCDLGIRLAFQSLNIPDAFEKREDCVRLLHAIARGEMTLHQPPSDLAGQDTSAERIGNRGVITDRDLAALIVAGLEQSVSVAEGPAEPLPLHTERLPLRVDAGGAVRVGNSRISLDLIVEQYENGMTPEALVRAYDTLVLADVHTVIAYYLRHRDEVRAYRKRRDQEAESLRAQIEAERPRVTQEEVLARRRARVEANAPTGQ